MDILKEKMILMERFGAYYETVYHLPPLAAKILSTLLLNFAEMTFEDVVKTTGASKSSVSTSLQLLLKFGKINFYTLRGDRKKYYRSAPLSERLDNYVKNIQTEKEIIDELEKYREKTARNASEFGDLELIKEYRIHVLALEQFLHKSIDKFKRLEDKRK